MSEYSTEKKILPSKLDIKPIASLEKYPIEDLIKNCEVLTGYKEEVAVGALFNSKEDEMSKEDFKKAITNFLNKEVE